MNEQELKKVMCLLEKAGVKAELCDTPIPLAGIAFKHSVFAQRKVSAWGGLEVDVVAAVVDMPLQGQPVGGAVANGAAEGHHVGQQPGAYARRNVDAGVASVVDERYVDRLGVVDAATAKGERGRSEQ